MNGSPSSPPPRLSAPLELDPTRWAPQDFYFLQTSLVVPRPIAWVSSVSATGNHNLAPHSYFNAICDDPPYVMFVVEGEKDTYRYVKETKEFVVNFVTLDLALEMEMTAVDFPPGEDEFHWAGLEPAPAKCVAPLRVAKAKACMECRLDQVIDIGKRNHVIVGKVVHVFVDHSIWRDGRVDPKLYKPLCRLGGRYAELGSVFKLTRPTWEQVKKKGITESMELVKRVDT